MENPSAPAIAPELRPDDPFGQLDTDRVLDRKYWTGLGFPAEPSVRQQLLAVTIDDVGRVGHSNFNAKLMCGAVRVAPSLVNHHFGGRDEMLAEAAAHCYADYVAKLWSAVTAAEPTPEARLKAWAYASIEWTAQMSGWAPVLNYPKASMSITQLVESRFGSHMWEHGQLNIARLHMLINDVRTGEVSSLDLRLGKLPDAPELSDPALQLRTASIAWSILGVATWHAGKHLPTRKLSGTQLFEQAVINDHLDRLIRSIREY